MEVNSLTLIAGFMWWRGRRCGEGFTEGEIPSDSFSVHFAKDFWPSDN